MRSPAVLLALLAAGWMSGCGAGGTPAAPEAPRARPPGKLVMFRELRCAEVVGRIETVNGPGGSIYLDLKLELREDWALVNSSP